MKDILFLHNKFINKTRWDECIKNAGNGRIYAYSWYLDILNPDWYGLVKDHYKFVMPVMSNKKLGFQYIIQPVYAQQHGVFPSPGTGVMNEFLNRLAQLSKYIHITLNAENTVQTDLFETWPKDNYILHLSPSYEDIVAGYNKHAKRYARKAGREVTIHPNVTADDYIALKKQASGKHMKAAYFDKLYSILHYAETNNMASIYGAFVGEEMCAAAAFLYDVHRIIYLNGVSSPLGRKHRAMFGVFNHFIKTHAGSKKILDFEGSSVAGVARFFQGFGAEAETYTVIRQNKLPRIIKWVKNING